MGKTEDGAVVTLLVWERGIDEEEDVERVDGLVLEERDRGRCAGESGGVGGMLIWR